MINEIAAKRFQTALQSKGMQYTLHFLESRDAYLEQDVVFFTKNKSENITDTKISDPTDPVYPSKCVILTCLLNGERTAFIGFHLKAIPTEPSAVAKREKQADAVVKQLNRLTAAGYVNLVLGDLNDWDPTTCWVEGESDYGIGEYFVIQPQRINEGGEYEFDVPNRIYNGSVSYTHLRAHETPEQLVWPLVL